MDTEKAPSTSSKSDGKAKEPTKAQVASLYPGDPMTPNPQMLKRIAGHISGAAKDKLAENWALAFLATYVD